MTKPGNRTERPSRPGWWTLLAISLSLIAVLFAKSAHSTSSSVAIEAYSHGHRTSAQLDWSIASTPPSNLRTSAVIAPVAVQTDADTQKLAPSYEAYSFPGYLSYPDNVISSFPIANAIGLVVVNAAWSPEAPLTVSVACGTTTQAATGSSAISLTIKAVSPSCTIAIQEEGKILGSVDYT